MKAKAKKRPAKRADHIVILSEASTPPGSGFQCLHCGNRQTIGFPINVDVYIAAANAYVRVHRKCKAKP